MKREPIANPNTFLRDCRLPRKHAGHSDHPTEARRRRERPEGAPQPPGYQERFEAIAKIERPFTNKTLSQWCYRIELLPA